MNFYLLKKNQKSMLKTKPMKRIFLVLALTLFCGTYPQIASAQLTSPTTKESTGILGTVSALNEKKSELYAKESLIEQEKNKTFPEKTKVGEALVLIESIEQFFEVQPSDTEAPETPEANAIKAEMETELAKLMDTNSATINAGNSEQTIEILKEKIGQWTTILEDKTTKREELIAATREEIDAVIFEIERLEDVYKKQMSALGNKVMWALGIILVLLILKFLSYKTIVRLTQNHSEKRKQILYSIHQWTFNIIFVLVGLVFFSSQFLSVLPFLAIVGTALGFALRDIISSFIAWFVIGIKDGYKIGDMILLGDVFGRVKDITPLLTIVEEQGMSGKTGKNTTFPNKKIFEEPIHNWSKKYNFTYIPLEFYLDQKTNVEKARKILFECIEKHNQESFERAQAKYNTLKREFKYTEEQIGPQTFLEIDPRGYLLRGKVFVDIDLRQEVRTNIIQEFSQRAQKEKDIKLLFWGLKGWFENM